MQTRYYPVDKIIQDIYKEKSRTTRTIPVGDPQLMFILNHIPENKECLILDAGCGDARYALHFKRLGYENIVTTDLFYHSKAIKNRHIIADNTYLPFAKEKFDFIYSNSVIYYLKNPKLGIYEFSRILKTGGKLVFSGHTRFSLFTLERRLKQILKPESVSHLKGVKFYGTNFYIRACRDSGLDIDHLDGFRLSYIIYPVFLRIVTGIRKRTGLRIPSIQNSCSRNHYIGKLKSKVAYHFVIVAHK